jgi:hypothetical protein
MGACGAKKCAKNSLFTVSVALRRSDFSPAQARREPEYTGWAAETGKNRSAAATAACRGLWRPKVVLYDWHLS